MKILTILPLFFCTALTTIKWQLREPIDLTWPVDELSLFWPNTRAFVYTRKLAEFNKDGEWYASNDFCMGEHGGTHIDAPYHFYKYGWKAGSIPVQRLFAHAIVVDMSEVVKRLGPTTELQKSDLVDWERIHGPMPPHCVVFVRFGWSEYYRNKELYFGLNGTTMVFPGISAEAAQWLADSRKVIGVGVDTASVDSGTSTTFEAHRIMAKHNIYNMENVNIVKKLPARGFSVIVMPLKLQEGSGSPVRIVAIPEIVLSADTHCSIDFSVNSVPWYGHTSVVLCSLLLLGMYAINCFTL